MTIASETELQALRAVGRVVARTLDAMEEATRAGITTAELDEVGGRVLAAHGARSAPRLVYGFPGNTCISVGDEVVHGVPGERVLRRGDVVKLDVTAELGGFMADAARTVVVGEPAGSDGLGAQLARCARSALRRGIAAARAGQRIDQIGREVSRAVHGAGFAVVRELTGHGIGRTIHEDPVVLNFDGGGSERLVEGMVLTIEPILAAGRGRVYTAPDGWTVRTTDRSPAAHSEHTLVITRGEPILLTAA